MAPRATAAGAAGQGPDSKSAPGASGAAAPAAKGELPLPPAPDAKAPQEPTEWPAVDIELAKARCTRLLKDIDAVTLPEAPLRKGECGAPAPVRLVSLGKSPPVAISPPALVTCDMVAALDKWMKESVRPLAKKHLGADVATIEIMSDYSCRHAYGRVGNKLSEHGRANALDIRGFVTTKGKTAHVLAAWGRTERDIAAELAAKLAAEKAEAERLAREKAEKDKRAKESAAQEKKEPGKTGTGEVDAGRASDEQAPAPEPGAAQAKVRILKPTSAPTAGAPGAERAVPPAPRVRTTIIEGVPKREAKLATAEGARVRSDAQQYIRSAPTRLGGPRPAGGAEDARAGVRGKPAAPDPAADIPPAVLKAAVAAEPVAPVGRFLREAHRAACRIFGTTLGPEANDDHRNHFHVDMAERKVKKVCD
jgi:hypothetical protein